MTNNARITARLNDLLEVMDARVTVNIFIDNSLLEKQTSIKYSAIYEILSDREFIKDYGDHEVIGLSCGFPSTNILIKEA